VKKALAAASAERTSLGPAERGSLIWRAGPGGGSRLDTESKPPAREAGP